MRTIYLFFVDTMRLMRGRPLLGEALPSIDGETFEERMSREYTEVASHMAAHRSS